MDYQAAIITMSDTRNLKNDCSGDVIEEIINQHGWQIAYRSIITDDFEEIKTELVKCCDELKIPLILTTGGTGFSQRDNTPEATQAVIEKAVPGISEAMRAKSNTITPKGMLSRGVSGIRKHSLIINLPGSPKAVRECLEEVIEPVKHGVEVLIGDAINCGESDD